MTFDDLWSSYFSIFSNAIFKKPNRRPSCYLLSLVDLVASGDTLDIILFNISTHKTFNSIMASSLNGKYFTVGYSSVLWLKIVDRSHSLVFVV